MASGDAFSGRKDFIQVIETFPCLFNIGTMNKPQIARLELMIQSLEDDVEELGELTEGFKIEVLNVLTWIYFQVGNLDKAKSKNDDSLCLNTDHIVTLGNRAFLEWYSGSNLSTFLGHLEKLKSEEDFPAKRFNAKGAQANLLFRLGGIYNTTSSIQMYNDLVSKEPGNYEFKHHLCIARRRLMVMTYNYQDEQEIEQMFRDIAENASDPYWQSSAMCEMAVRMAFQNEPLRVLENLIERAIELSGRSPPVLRKCGMAFARKLNPKGIALLEESDSLKPNTVTQHNLAKALINYSVTRHMDRNECDKKAVLSFNKAYELSKKDNIGPLVDLGFLFLKRKRFREALETYRSLVQNWNIKNHKKPFMLSKIFGGLYTSLKKTGGNETDPFFDRYLAIAISSELETLKCHKSPSEKSLIFDLVVNPATGSQCENVLLVHMLRDCVSENCGRQKLMELQLQRRLGDMQSVTQELEMLLGEGKPGEALLMLDVIEFQENNQLEVLQKLQGRAMLEEATWQLGQGLVSCGLLFHKLFNICHSNASFGEDRHREGDAHDKASPEADILIFHDGHHWKPFLENTTDLCLSDENRLGYVHQNRMYEDIIMGLFGLETITNPWLSFSGENLPDTKEFSVLLKHFNVRLVLLVVDAKSSSGFLQMADFLLSKIHTAKETDLAIVYTEGDAEAFARSQMPKLTQSARCFKADERGFQMREDYKPLADLVGTEVIDAYFSGEVGNAIDFFKFLVYTGLDFQS